MHSDRERKTLAKELFLHGLAVSEEDRGRWLEEAAAGDRALLDEVRSLFEAHEAVDAGFASPLLVSADSQEGRRIDAYQVQRRLGRGGMGEVYLAVRADAVYSRRVAIKLLQDHLDPEAARRFRTERQILAGLDHPNIAQLLDGGSTQEGTPYLVMEYVEGTPIDDYCRLNRLSLRDRVRLFRQVCSAVQFAHGNLVVHRDLKPANILVTAAGVPKLLDFGIAKLINPDLTGHSSPGTAGLHLPMTLGYASPEQVRGDPISATSDVYSLGVLLYELLTGASPYAESDDPSAALVQAVCEVEPKPPSLMAGRPDSRGTKGEPPASGLATAGLPDELSAVRRRLAGDLDAIVLRCLRKAPQERYGSVEQFSEDLRRWLEGLPVAAREGGVAYRGRKLAVRYRWAVAGVVAVILTCLGFAIVTAAKNRTIVRERDRAARESMRAQEVKQFLFDLFHSSDPLLGDGSKLSARDLLDQGAAKLETQKGLQPGLRAELEETIGSIFVHLGELNRAEPLLSRAVVRRREDPDGSPMDLVESLRKLGTLHLARKDGQGALATLNEARAHVVEIDAGSHRFGLLLNDLGRAHHDLRDFPQAREYYEQALELLREQSETGDAELAGVLNNLAAVAGHLGDYAACEDRHREVLALRRSLHGTEHPHYAESLNNLGVALRYQGKNGEARTVSEEALALRVRQLGDRHPRVANAHHNLAGVLQDLGELELAEEHYREAMSINAEVHGGGSFLVAIGLQSLGAVRLEQDLPAQAAGFLGRAEALLRPNAPDHPARAWGLILLGEMHLARGEASSAMELAQQATEILHKPGPGQRWRRGAAHLVLARALYALGREAEAEPVLSEAIEALAPEARGRAVRRLREARALDEQLQASKGNEAA